MIIKGKSNNNKGGALCRYLSGKGENEKADQIEIKGAASDDLQGWFQEMTATASGTRCRSAFYHASINPQAHEHLTREQYLQGFDLLEKNLGLEDHPRVIVQHIDDKGREHYHAAWSRINPDTLKAVRMSHNFRNHEKTSRELERLFDLERVQGVHVEREGERPRRAFSEDETKQAKRKGVNLKELRAEVTEVWNNTQSGAEFVAALEAQGFGIAKGDKRDLVLIDRQGGVHSLARRIEGAGVADVRERMKDVDREALPSVEEAKAAHRERGAENFPKLAEQIEREKANEQAKAAEQAKIDAQLKLPRRARDYSVLDESRARALEQARAHRELEKPQTLRDYSLLEEAGARTQAGAKPQEQKQKELDDRKENKAPTVSKKDTDAGERIAGGAVNAALNVADGVINALDGVLDFLCGAVPKTYTPPTPEEKAVKADQSQADIMRELFEMGRQTDEERAAAAARDDDERERSRGRRRGR